jgi:hypothetical protein
MIYVSYDLSYLFLSLQKIKGTHRGIKDIPLDFQPNDRKTAAIAQ